MFASSAGISRSNSADNAVKDQGGGMLQGFRRKMGRFSSNSSPSLISPLNNNAENNKQLTPTTRSVTNAATIQAMEEAASHEFKAKQVALTHEFTMLTKRFEEQDSCLRLLEQAVVSMLQNIQTACNGMTRTVEAFTQSLRYDSASYQLGVECLALVTMIGHNGADKMDQSIRFTVLDPLLARLQRHDQLKVQLKEWEKLVSTVEEVQAATEVLQATRSEKDDRRMQAEAKLNNLQAQLMQIQSEITPVLVETIDDAAMHNQAHLFEALRLQLAIFFFYAHQSMFSGLSEMERELVTKVGQPTNITSPTSRTGKLDIITPRSDSTASDTLEEQTTLATVLGEDKDDQEFRVSITLEEFEMGVIAPDLPDCTAPSSVQHPLMLSTRDTTELFALASNPVIVSDPTDESIHSEEDMSSSPDLPHTFKGDSNEEPRMFRRATLPLSEFSVEQHHAMLQRRHSGVLSSIRRSFQVKFRSRNDVPSDIVSVQQGAMGSISSPSLDVIEAESNSRLILPERPNKHQLRYTSLATSEWQAIETCLWEIDASRDNLDATKVLPEVEQSLAHADDFLSQFLPKHKSLFYDCLSYLRIEDIAHVAQANRKLRSYLINCAPLWKRSVRSCGLTPSLRSAIWLSTFYEATPWRSEAIASHHLSGEKRKQIYEQLLVKVGNKMADGTLSELSSRSTEDVEQLRTWMHDIDVDVARTCNKDIYAKDVAEEQDLFSPRNLVPHSESNPSLLANMAENPLLSPNRSHDNQCLPHSEYQPKAGISIRKCDLEAKIRRILRAYVMYNPRVGYCQGMNFLVRLLMDVVDDEADVFWLFAGFSEPANDRNLYEPGLAVLQPFLSKFEVLVSTYMPELYAHFQTEGAHVAAFSTRWFLTFFSSFETFGPTFVIRLLDIFVIDGWRILFSTALVVLDELHELLLESDVEEILRILQFPRNYMVEPDHARRQELLRRSLGFSISRMINTL